MVEYFREEIKTYDREARQVLNTNKNKKWSYMANFPRYRASKKYLFSRDEFL